jgi:hypothetical protein
MIGNRKVYIGSCSKKCSIIIDNLPVDAVLCAPAVEKDNDKPVVGAVITDFGGILIFRMIA